MSIMSKKFFNCKQLLKSVYVLIFALFICVSFSTDLYAAPSKYVKSLIVKNKVSVDAGDKVSVPIKVNVVGDASKKISYKVSNKKIAKASYSSKTSKLIITGVKKGSTKVTITTKGRNDKGSKLKKVIKITVKEADASTEEKTYTFRKPSNLTQHFEKHGAEMGYNTEEEYLAGANAVINNPNALHKLEAEDNDHVYYIEATNEIVFLSQDGYIRTYFICSGKDYFDRQ